MDKGPLEKGLQNKSLAEQRVQTQALNEVEMQLVKPTQRQHFKEPVPDLFLILKFLWPTHLNSW